MKTKGLLLFFLSIFLVSSAYGQADSKLAQAWILGSKLALAGALQAQSGDQGLIDRQFAAASAAAGTLGIKLPPLPAVSGTRVDKTASVLAYLLRQTGEPIGGILVQSYGTEHAAVFEVALKSNILLMMYGPGESTATATANAIRNRSAKTTFLPSMTKELLSLIDRGASFDEVKKELFNIHDLAPKFIAVIEYGRDGEAKYGAKDYIGSAAAYTKALVLDPDGPEYYYGRGRAYTQLNRNAEAIADYTKVIQLEGSGSSAGTNLSVAYNNRGLLYGLTGKYAAAIADLSQAIKLRPDYASAYKIRGLVYKKMGNAAAAKRDLDTAERLQPGITQ
jgi:tetratricopeptide (TPR) repeat protein